MNKRILKFNLGYYNFETSQKVPRVGGPLRLTGRGGAPKFFLNWLTFAL